MIPESISSCFPQICKILGYDFFYIVSDPINLSYNLELQWHISKIFFSFKFRLPSILKPNITIVTEFFFEGFSNFGWQHRLIFFIVFLTLYLLTLSGNVIIITIIRLNRHLHTPMYFFLSILSISETCYTVAIIPRMLSGLLNPHQSIAFQECATQLFFYLTFGINNCYLLTVMGYDRYVAICNPLRYSVIMGKRSCVYLASGSLGIGLSMAIIQVTSVFGLPFCDAFVISHFYCDVRPLLKLACADTTANEIVNFVVSVCVLVVPMGLIFISYVLIISTILKIASAEGRKKAFATCASHLTVVIIHYGCTSIIYLQPKSQSSPERDRLISVTYTVITPLLNPVVYSLRNKEVKDALLRAMGRKPLTP
ncbi:PREDICTED: olfactory receptor 10J3-like [Elephantulus edwardii]|uniref:olfactory receptor 10J3-like n=1 Tax=Elephantulus edwardii TaxID=28737 RepID=UPI0003F08376|nr:PREDICTED: olfactory receptor 10J3-like [Elephantulus edwardii]